MSLKLGIYEHFKGRRYKVTCIAKDSKTYEETVVYEALYNNELSKVWTRPLKSFKEVVLVDGKEKPRFKFVEN